MRRAAVTGLEYHCSEFAGPHVHDTSIPKAYVNVLSVDDDCRVNDALSGAVNTVILDSLGTHGPPILKFGINVNPGSIK
jgi:hypothetical protein